MRLKNFNLAERMHYYKVPGVSITLFDQGQISACINQGVLEVGSRKAINENSLFNACSISKFLTGMLVIKLVQQGDLDLDENVNEKLISWNIPENDFTNLKRVTLRNLLSHQSGIVDPINSFPEHVASNGTPTMVELLEGKTPYNNCPIEVTYEPESEFHYSDASYCIIQQVIEDSMKKSFIQVMTEHIFTPLEMENSNYAMTAASMSEENVSCGHNKNGEVVNEKYPLYPYPAASGLWTTSENIAKLVQELMNALKGESKTGISARAAKELISSQGRKKWAGLGVFLEESENQLEISSLGWGVGFQCMMVAYPYLEKGAVIMTNAELGVHQLEGIIGEIYNSLLSQLKG